MSIETEYEIVDQGVYERAVQRFKKAGIKLPKISQLADPVASKDEINDMVGDADPDAPDARNLFRVHWHNGVDRKSFVDVPDHIVLPPELTNDLTLTIKLKGLIYAKFAMNNADA